MVGKVLFFEVFGCIFVEDFDVFKVNIGEKNEVRCLFKFELNNIECFEVEKFGEEKKVIDERGKWKGKRGVRVSKKSSKWEDGWNWKNFLVVIWLE